MAGRRCVSSKPAARESNEEGLVCCHCGSGDFPDLLICICDCHKKSEDAGLVHRQCVEGLLRKTLASHCPNCRSEYFIPSDCDEKLRRTAIRLALVQFTAAIIFFGIIITVGVILVMPGPPEEGDPEEEIPLSGLAQLVVSPKDWWSESVVEEFMTTVEPSFPSLGRSSHFLQKGISRRRHRMLALRLAAVALMTVVALSLFFGTRSLQNRRRAITQDLETLDSTRLVALLDELLGPNARMKAVRDGQW